MYSVDFVLCDAEFDGCDEESRISSQDIPVIDSHPSLSQSWCLDSSQDKQVEKYSPLVYNEKHVNFSFAYQPCLNHVLPYEQVVVSVYKAEKNESVCENGLEILKSNVPVTAAHLLNIVEKTAVITYQVISILPFFDFVCLQN